VNGRRNRTDDGRRRGVIGAEDERADTPTFELSPVTGCETIERVVPPLSLVQAAGSLPMGLDGRLRVFGHVFPAVRP
jgi:hypothetical protein